MLLITNAGGHSLKQGNLFGLMVSEASVVASWLVYFGVGEEAVAREKHYGGRVWQRKPCGIREQSGVTTPSRR